MKKLKGIQQYVLVFLFLIFKCDTKITISRFSSQKVQNRKVFLTCSSSRIENFKNSTKNCKKSLNFEDRENSENILEFTKIFHFEENYEFWKFFDSKHLTSAKKNVHSLGKSR